MLEVGCSNIVLDEVLKTSGHVDKFADFMVKDSKTGTPRRADKLIEDHIAKILPKKKKPEEIAELEKIAMEVETYEAAQLDEVIEKLKIKDPETGAPLTKAELFNLMFGAAIGPTGHLHGYLRPETAQGIFINFRRLIEFNNGRMPFAAAQIGMGFRNEVSPRQGLLRVREFTMGEIEHFYDPQNKDHPKFNEIVDVKFPMWTAQAQEEGSKTMVENLNLGAAVEQGVVKNQILAYFMGRTYLFLTACGIKPEGIRFRQHKAKEMAHYANDCWDAEVETSYGWIEVSGCSDRSAFDLEKHMTKTKVELTAARPIEPIKVTNVVYTLDMKIVGKEFKAVGKDIKTFVEELTEEDKKSLKSKWDEEKSLVIDIKGKEITLNETHLKVEEVTKTIHEEKYIPWVIEPSFGIGRIIYCIFEHCFKSRPEDAQRTYFDFPATIAPLKCSLLPLINRQELNDKTREIKRSLIKAGISNKLDDTGVTVGKRYARTDECGIPYALTIDFETLE
jgi:glycyl-tRNA synthetase